MIVDLDLYTALAQFFRDDFLAQGAINKKDVGLYHAASSQSSQRIASWMSDLERP